MASAMEPSALLRDPGVSAVHRGVAYLSAIERRLAPYFERAEPCQRAITYLRGLLSSAERKNRFLLHQYLRQNTRA
jgi:hypothetical protein